MSPEKPLAWLGKQKEKRALKLSRKHMNKIVETTESMRDAVSAFCENEENIVALSEKVFDKERSADRTKAEILDELSKGNFPPMSREEIMRLVITADDVADNARAAAMKLTFLDPEDVDHDVKDGLKKLSEFAYETTKLLENAFSALLENPEAAIDGTGKVEKLEEKIDHFRARNLIPKIVEWADKTQRPGTSNFLAEVEDNIEEVADQAENCADVIREIAIGSI